MDIKTKYKPGDKVILLKDNKVVEKEIDIVNTISQENSATRVLYKLVDDGIYIDEDRLFSNKKELLASL